MIETIQHMNQSQARSFLESAFDCSVPKELLAYVSTLPEAPEVEDEPLTLAQQRAAIWADIRATWRPTNRWETHWDHARWYKIGLKGAIERKKRQRRITSRLLDELVIIRKAEQIAANVAREAA
jgi:hypothetical protein